MERTASKLAKSLKKATEDPLIGSKFPELKVKSLAGTWVTLPKAGAGKVRLIGIAFERKAQSMLDSWFVPFEKEFGKNPRYQAYEIPMIGPNWNFLSLIIDSGMRDGIPAEKHAYVLPVYEDYSKYQKELDLKAKELAYLFLLDKKGLIRWKGKGYPTAETLQEMILTARISSL